MPEMAGTVALQEVGHCPAFFVACSSLPLPTDQSRRRISPSLTEKSLVLKKGRRHFHYPHKKIRRRDIDRPMLLLCDILCAQRVSRRLGVGVCVNIVYPKPPGALCWSLMESFVHSRIQHEIYVNLHYGRCVFAQRETPARAPPTKEPPHTRSCLGVCELSASGWTSDRS